MRTQFLQALGDLDQDSIAAIMRANNFVSPLELWTKFESMYPPTSPTAVYTLRRDVKDNSAYRKVFRTGKHLQVVLMTLKPGQDIGLETHADTDQILQVEQGVGECVVDGKRSALKPGATVFIDAGQRHNITNTGNVEMKLVSIYAPPEHPGGLVQLKKLKQTGTMLSATQAISEMPKQVAFLLDENGITAINPQGLYGGKSFFRKTCAGVDERNEADICRILMAHPQKNVVDVYGVTDDYIDLQNLDPIRDASEMIAAKHDVANGLIQLHALDIAYIDLKHDNVGYDTVARCYKIFDFNASGRMTPNHQTWIQKPPEYWQWRHVEKICAKPTSGDVLGRLCLSPMLTRYDAVSFYEIYGQELYPT
jgi:mannose-6-phosphate isomerase-like protein (cupin superfamily)